MISDRVHEAILEAMSKDTKSLTERALKLAEECGELAQAVLRFSGVSGCITESDQGETTQNILEESVDVLLVVISIMISMGFSESEIDATLMRKCLKWKNKVAISRAEIQDMNE